VLARYHDKPISVQVDVSRQFLLKWGFYSSLILRDMTFRTAQSFGSFHLIRLLYDEYMFFLIENRLAKATNQPVICVMSQNWLRKHISAVQHPMFASISHGQNLIASGTYTTTTANMSNHTQTPVSSTMLSLNGGAFVSDIQHPMEHPTSCHYVLSSQLIEPTYSGGGSHSSVNVHASHNPSQSHTEHLVIPSQNSAISTGIHYVLDNNGPKYSNMPSSIISPPLPNGMMDSQDLSDILVRDDPTLSSIATTNHTPNRYMILNSQHRADSHPHHQGHQQQQHPDYTCSTTYSSRPSNQIGQSSIVYMEDDILESNQNHHHHHHHQEQDQQLEVEQRSSAQNYLGDEMLEESGGEMMKGTSCNNIAGQSEPQAMDLQENNKSCKVKIKIENP
jgi:hypothetical protein